MLYLGIEGRLENLAHHTIYLSDDYQRNIAEIEEGQVPPGEPSFYVQNACVTDPAAGAARPLHAVRAGAGRPRARRRASTGRTAPRYRA